MGGVTGEHGAPGQAPAHGGLRGQRTVRAQGSPAGRCAARDPSLSPNSRGPKTRRPLPGPDPPGAAHLRRRSQSRKAPHFRREGRAVAEPMGIPEGPAKARLRQPRARGTSRGRRDFRRRGFPGCRAENPGVFATLDGGSLHPVGSPHHRRGEGFGGAAQLFRSLNQSP